MSMESIVILLTGIIGATATAFVNVRLKQGPVRSSALLSLVVGLVATLLPENTPETYQIVVPIVFFGASFIGMVSSGVMRNYLLVGLAGLCFSIIYVNTGQFFNGYGGALGTTASISLLLVISVSTFLKKRGLTRQKVIKVIRSGRNTN